MVIAIPHESVCANAAMEAGTEHRPPLKLQPGVRNRSSAVPCVPYVPFVFALMLMMQADCKRYMMAFSAASLLHLLCLWLVMFRAFPFNPASIAWRSDGRAGPFWIVMAACAIHLSRWYTGVGDEVFFLCVFCGCFHYSVGLCCSLVWLDVWE